MVDGNSHEQSRIDANNSINQSDTVIVDGDSHERSSTVDNSSDASGTIVVVDGESHELPYHVNASTSIDQSSHAVVVSGNVHGQSFRVDTNTSTDQSSNAAVVDAHEQSPVDMDTVINESLADVTAQQLVVDNATSQVDMSDPYSPTMESDHHPYSPAMELDEEVPSQYAPVNAASVNLSDVHLTVSCVESNLNPAALEWKPASEELIQHMTCAAALTVPMTEDHFFQLEALGTTVNPECGGCKCGKSPVPGSLYSFKEQTEYDKIMS